MVRLRVRVVDVQRVPDAAAVAHAEVEHLHQAGPEWLLEHPQSMVVMLLLFVVVVVVVGGGGGGGGGGDQNDDDRR